MNKNENGVLVRVCTFFYFGTHTRMSSSSENETHYSSDDSFEKKPPLPIRPRKKKKQHHQKTYDNLPDRLRALIMWETPTASLLCVGLLTLIFWLVHVVRYSILTLIGLVILFQISLSWLIINLAPAMQDAGLLPENFDEETFSNIDTRFIVHGAHEMGYVMADIMEEFFLLEAEKSNFLAAFVIAFTIMTLYVSTEIVVYCIAICLFIVPKLIN